MYDARTRMKDVSFRAPLFSSVYFLHALYNV